jgi:hypothetical protein
MFKQIVARTQDFATEYARWAERADATLAAQCTDFEELRGDALARHIDAERERTYSNFKSYLECVREHNRKHPPIIMCVTCLGIVGETCNCEEIADGFAQWENKMSDAEKTPPPEPAEEEEEEE